MRNRYDEKVDLVDGEGMVVRSGIWRSEVKRDREQLTAAGLYLPIVIIVMFDAHDRVVVQERGALKSNAGQIDHTCGGILSGEDVMAAAKREAAQEVRAHLNDMLILGGRVNEFGRYRTLLAARTLSTPAVGNEYEVARVLTLPPAELRQHADQGTLKFVNGFFEDLNEALAAL